MENSFHEETTLNMDNQINDCSLPFVTAIKQELDSDEEELQPPLCVTLMPVKLEDGEEFHVSDTPNADTVERKSIPFECVEPTLEEFVKEENPIFSDSDTEKEKIDTEELPVSPKEGTDLKVKDNTREISWDPNAKAYSCPKCGKWFPTFRGIKQHLERHSNTRPYSCNQCTAAYTDSSTLRRHKKTVHSLSHDSRPEKKPFACANCDMAFETSYKLTIHRRMHSEERTFTCEQCGMRFGAKAYLASHISTKHTGELPFECPVCGKRFSYRTSIRYHLQTHEGLKAHRCETCGKAFISFWKLKQHITALHNTDPGGPSRLHQCTQCYMSYRYAAGLRLHIRSVHSGDRPFCCEQCGATFSDGSYLTIHRRKHSKDRPLRCSECDMTFKYKANLSRHKASKHKQKADDNI